MILLFFIWFFLIRPEPEPEPYFYGKQGYGAVKSECLRQPPPLPYYVTVRSNAQFKQVMEKADTLGGDLFLRFRLRDSDADGLPDAQELGAARAIRDTIGRSGWTNVENYLTTYTNRGPMIARRDCFSKELEKPD